MQARESDAQRCREAKQQFKEATEFVQVETEKRERARALRERAELEVRKNIRFWLWIILTANTFYFAGKNPSKKAQ